MLSGGAVVFLVGSLCNLAFAGDTANPQNEKAEVGATAAAAPAKTYFPDSCSGDKAKRETYDYFYGLTESGASASGMGGDFEIDPPRFDLGAKFKSKSDCDKVEAMSSCVEKYEHSMKEMESAIASAAINDPAVLPFARKMARRLVTILEAKAHQEENGDKAAIAKNVDKKLLEAFGACNPKDAGCLASAKSCNGDQACLDKSAARIREALNSGNLREAMFFLYRSNTVLANNVSRSETPAEENQRNIDAINRYLRDRGEDWQLGANIPTNPKGKYILPRVGHGQHNSRMRDPRIAAGNGQFQCANYADAMNAPKIKSVALNQMSASPLALIKLSDREEDFMAESLKVSKEDLPNQALPWWSGENCFVMKDKIADPQYATYNEYLRNGIDAKIPMVSGVSGTADSIFALGRALGLKSQRDFRLLRAATVGWLVSERDHSVHEVMTASQSFKEIVEKYKFKADHYQRLLPESSVFSRNVEKYFSEHKLELPQKILKTCLAR